MPNPLTSPLRSAVIRRLAPWILGGTFVVLALVAITRSIALREQMMVQALDQISDRLDDEVRRWEDDFLSVQQNWLETIAERSDSPAAVQERIRSTLNYVDAVYLFRPAQPTSSDQGPSRVTPATMIFPKPHPVTSAQEVASHPCLADARKVQYAGASPEQAASAYLAGCRDTDPATRLDAGSAAAAILVREGLYDDALGALDATGVSPDLTLAAGLDLGIAADRTIVYRNQRAAIRMQRGQIGDEEAAINLYYETGQQIAELDAPDAIGLETWQWTLLDELREHNRDRLLGRLEIAFRGLDRRIRAYREITSQILPQTATLASEEPRLIRDQYDEQPFLLYYGVRETSTGERVGVAIQLNEQRVLNDFLNNTDDLSTDLSITDASGSWVLGERQPGRALSVKVPFSRTLTHLRVGVFPDAVQRRAQNLDERWFLPLVVIVLVLIIGIFALSAQVRAQRRLADLLARQREFTTRVTHELKTPLAGIKVMAETLEIGAFRGEAGRQDAARRIVAEADRLTARIDEVLTVTREPSLPDPEVFDVEDVLYELIDIWGPRLEQHGVLLVADLDDAPQVKGDPKAVRDAVGCLLDNALKYRDPERDDPGIIMSLGREGRVAVVSVSDNGLGVPPQMRKKVFDRFVRVEGDNRGLSGGHGLGLAQVAQTAERHGGSVVCEESDEGGARFVLRLKGLKD